MIRKVDFISELLGKEVVKFVEQNGAEAIKKMQTQDFVNGAVVLNIPIKRTAITSLLTDCRFPIRQDSFDDLIAEYDSSFEEEYTKFMSANHYDNEENNTGNYYGNLFGKITDQIVKIDKAMSFEDCINMAIKFRNKLGSKFYGCMLKSYYNSDIVINPFHILTTLSCIENSKSSGNEVLNVLKDKFFLIVYVNQNEEELDVDYGSYMAEMNLIDQNINCLMQVYTSKIEQKIKIEESNINVSSREEINRIMNGGNIQIKYKTSVEEDLDDDYNYYICAHQAGTHGIMFPFYGASLVRMTKSFTESKGTSLTPFNSVNISGSYNNSPSNITYDSVCTGSEYNNTTMQGLRTLTHSNYGSPYSSSKSLHPGCLVYARRMIEKSLEIYRKSNFINFEEEEDVAIDFEELIKNSLESYSKKDKYKSSNDDDGDDDDDSNF